MATVQLVTSSEPSGVVTAQEPGSGAKLAHGSHVRLEVSRGEGAPTTTATSQAPAAAPTRETVPDVAGLSVQDAARKIGSARLLVSIQYVPGQDPLGTVLAQAPASNEPARALSHVTLGVSRGPNATESESVPVLVGKTLDDAVAAANAAGLRSFFLKRAVSTRAEAGRVVEQTPRPGAAAPRNAQVLIYLGAFRAP